MIKKVLKYKHLTLYILCALILLNSTNVFAGNGKEEEEELNYFPASSLSKSSAQLTPNFEKPQSTARPLKKRRQNNSKARFVRLEDFNITPILDKGGNMVG